MAKNDPAAAQHADDERNQAFLDWCGEVTRLLMRTAHREVTADMKNAAVAAGMIPPDPEPDDPRRGKKKIPPDPAKDPGYRKVLGLSRKRGKKDPVPDPSKAAEDPDESEPAPAAKGGKNPEPPKS